MIAKLCVLFWGGIPTLRKESDFKAGTIATTVMLTILSFFTDFTYLNKFTYLNTSNFYLSSDNRGCTVVTIANRIYIGIAQILLHKKQVPDVNETVHMVTKSASELVKHCPWVRS